MHMRTSYIHLGPPCDPKGSMCNRSKIGRKCLNSHYYYLLEIRNESPNTATRIYECNQWHIISGEMQWRVQALLIKVQ